MSLSLASESLSFSSLYDFVLSLLFRRGRETEGRRTGNGERNERDWRQGTGNGAGGVSHGFARSGGAVITMHI